jgi:bacillithiol biosynthesis deacetylase BshB1
MSQKLDVLAIGAHPDDVELGCGATVALLAEQGFAVGILHLTRGENGTRGSGEEREAEARAAAAALGAVVVDFLDCGDGSLRHGEAEEDALIEKLRLYRPELVLSPAPTDRHPDHGRAHRLVADACFYSGLRRRAAGRGGEPHRPATNFSYMQNDAFEPAFIVDVSRTWEKKVASLAAYSSQLYGPSSAARAEPATKVASREFAKGVEGRARHFGVLIGVEFGEPFWSRQPLAVADPMAVVPRGLR